MVFREELIGSNIEVTRSSNLTLIGVEGKVIDEIKDMTTLDNKKMIKKESVWLKVFDGKESFDIDGKLLVERPKDRLKVANKNE